MVDAAPLNDRNFSPALVNSTDRTQGPALQDGIDNGKRSFGDFLITFCTNLWGHRLLLGAGFILIGVALFTMFVDVVGMGLPAPFLAPVMFGSFYVGGSCIGLAILFALHETSSNAVTLHFPNDSAKKQFWNDFQNLQFGTLDDALKKAVTETEAIEDEVLDLVPDSLAADFLFRSDDDEEIVGIALRLPERNPPPGDSHNSTSATAS